MRRLLVLFLLVGGTLAPAQTVPRIPVVVVRTPGGGPAPTPAPTPTPVPILPDPSGIYEGSALLKEGDQTFNQTWTAEVQAQPCPDCPPGVYYIDATTFNAFQYSDGATEKGGIRGIVGAGGELLGLAYIVANCPYIQANGRYNVATYYGGNFGEQPGTKLTIKNGLLSGSVSGHDCFLNPFTATVSMTRISKGPILSCVPGFQAGSYNATFANSCGLSGSSDLELIRSGCIASAVAPELAALEATMTGPTTFNVLIHDLTGCKSNSTGTGTINPKGIIMGTYSGTSPGGFGCCPAGAFTGSFVLVPR